MSEWIDVKQALPPEEGEYLTFSVGYKESSRNVVSLDWYGGEEGRQMVWLNIRMGKNFGITHWMPLPEAPNGKG